jgi:hypothetical protein
MRIIIIHLCTSVTRELGSAQRTGIDPTLLLLICDMYTLTYQHRHQFLRRRSQ